jgi:hypothetical protein
MKMLRGGFHERDACGVLLGGKLRGKNARSVSLPNKLRGSKQFRARRESD